MASSRIIHLGETGSTMDEARRLASALAEDAQRGDEAARASLRAGGLITSERQIRGRGTQGRAWASPRGALMGTYWRWLPVGVGYSWIPPLTLRTALGIAELAEGWIGASSGVGDSGTGGAVIRIKWPNDIVLGDGKLAGVLIEAMEVSEGEAAMTIVLIGVGLNANNPPPELPRGERAAASLIEHTGGAVDLTMAAQRLAEALMMATDAACESLTHDEIERLNARLYGRGRCVRVSSGGGGADDRVPAVVDAINGDGSLRVLVDGAARVVRRTHDVRWPLSMGEWG